MSAEKRLSGCGWPAGGVGRAARMKVVRLGNIAGKGDWQWVKDGEALL